MKKLSAVCGLVCALAWFDMFRLENGKIAEHRDPAQKQ
jgi:predicted SnoaL-like aldol condensation-catalyzing enzyme